MPFNRFSGVRFKELTSKGIDKTEIQIEKINQDCPQNNNYEGGVKIYISEVDSPEKF